jgi:hypothetical protein
MPIVTGAGGFGTPLDDTDIGVVKSTSGNKGDGAGGDSDEEDDVSGGMGTDAFVNDGDVSSDQFARYLCQQIVSDFPDRGMLGGESSDEEEEDEEEDVVDAGVEDTDWAPSPLEENPFPKKVSSLGDDFDDDPSSSEDDNASEAASAEKASLLSQVSGGMEPEKVGFLTPHVCFKYLVFLTKQF